MKTLEDLRKEAEDAEIGHDESKDSAYIHGFYRQIFRAGWDAAVNKLVKWHDPKFELPEISCRIAILGEFSDDIPAETGGWYDADTKQFHPDINGIFTVIGWRHIYKLGK